MKIKKVSVPEYKWFEGIFSDIEARLTGAPTSHN